MQPINARHAFTARHRTASQASFAATPRAIGCNPVPCTLSDDCGVCIVLTIFRGVKAHLVGGCALVISMDRGCKGYNPWYRYWYIDTGTPLREVGLREGYGTDNQKPQKAAATCKLRPFSYVNEMLVL